MDAKSSLDAIEKGPTHEVYRGLTFALRTDWNSMAVRYTFTGRVESSCGGLIARRLEEMVRMSPSFTVLHDFWDASVLDSQVRVSFVEWSNQHPRALASVHALAQSKIVTMSLSTWGMAVPGLKIYSRRPEFDILCKKFGLPINISLPAVTGI